MSIGKLVWSVIIVLFVTVTALGATDPIVDCRLSRITVPVAEKDGKVVCAASFMYGEYVKNPQIQADLLNSRDLIDKFDQLPEESRWQYPEYVIIKNLQAWRAGDKEGILSCFEPGYSRDTYEAMFLKPGVIEQTKPQMEPFTEEVFLDKSYFGPYVRIYSVTSEPVPPAPTGKKIRGLAGVEYLKRVGNRYMLTREIDMTHIFDVVVGGYGAKKTMFRENIPLNPDTSGMDWFAIDVDVASPAENKKMLRVFSIEGASGIPQSFSENYLKVYVKCEPINVQLEAGKQLKNLPGEVRFFESAVTKHQLGTESEILSLWSGRSKEKVRKDIELLKNAGEWPKLRGSPFGEAPAVLALMPTSSGTVLYYKKKAFYPDCPHMPPGIKERIISQVDSKIYSVGLQADGGTYTLFNVSSKGEFNVFTNPMFVDAISVLYGQKPLSK